MSNPQIIVGEHKISGLQTSSRSTVMINNLKRFTEVRIKDLEIFPGKKFIFLIKSLPTYAPAGKVELTLGETSQSFNFGDSGSGRYLEFDNTNIPVKLPDAAGEDTLEIKLTLFTPGFFPDSLKSSKHLFAKNLKIMNDKNTADMKISCGKKEKMKIFHVHKNFLCASSPVFQAAMESDMLEGKTKEIHIEDADEKSVQEMIQFIYTGDFTGADLNVRMVAWLADKYDLPDMMDLLCVRMKQDQVVEPVKVADILIAAGKTRQHFFSL